MHGLKMPNTALVGGEMDRGDFLGLVVQIRLFNS